MSKKFLLPICFIDGIFAAWQIFSADHRTLFAATEMLLLQCFQTIEKPNQVRKLVKIPEYLQEVVNRVKLCHLQRIMKRVRSYPKNQIRKKKRQDVDIYHEDYRFEFTEDEGAQFVNESIAKQTLVNALMQRSNFHQEQLPEPSHPNNKSPTFSKPYCRG